MANRFVSASEKSTQLARGVYLRAMSQDIPVNSHAYEIAEAQYQAWKRDWPELAEKAEAVQVELFDWCLAQ